MIIMIKGNVRYTITLDPSVWIFDDRKVALEDFLNEGLEPVDDLFPGSRPPVMESLEKFKKSGSISGSYLMPLAPFLERAEPFPNSTEAHLLDSDSETVAVLTMEELVDSSLLFSMSGKQLKDDGPVHLYVRPDSTPIKSFVSINII